MAMTKAERALVEELTTARDLARSLRWPEQPRPQPYTEEEIQAIVQTRATGVPGGAVASGWMINVHTKQVDVGWTTLHTHKWGYSSRETMDVHTSSAQGMGQVYRTYLDALMALRFDLTVKFAEELAEIDQLIAEERGG